LVVVFAPPEGDPARLEDAAQRLSVAFARFAGGRTVRAGFFEA